MAGESGSLERGEGGGQLFEGVGVASARKLGGGWRRLGGASWVEGQGGGVDAELAEGGFDVGEVVLEGGPGGKEGGSRGQAQVLDSRGDESGLGCEENGGGSGRIGGELDTIRGGGEGEIIAARAAISDPFEVSALEVVKFS